METQTGTSETATTRKFLFDLAFDHGLNKTTEREKPKPTFSEEQLEEAKKRAFEEGMTAGQKSMMENQQQYMNTLLTQIDQKLAHVIQTSLDVWQDQLAQCQEIALVIVRKIIPTYVKQHGLDEINAIVTKVISEMGREPRLVFRVCEQQFDEASARINSIAQQSAYAGKIVILGDPEIGESDCRIEWADGGIERDLKALWQEIDKVMAEVQSYVPPQPKETTEQQSSEAGDKT